MIAAMTRLLMLIFTASLAENAVFGRALVTRRMLFLKKREEVLTFSAVITLMMAVTGLIGYFLDRFLFYPYGISIYLRSAAYVVLLGAELPHTDCRPFKKEQPLVSDCQEHIAPCQLQCGCAGNSALLLLSPLWLTGAVLLFYRHRSRCHAGFGTHRSWEPEYCHVQSAAGFPRSADSADIYWNPELGSLWSARASAHRLTESHPVRTQRGDTMPKKQRKVKRYRNIYRGSITSSPVFKAGAVVAGVAVVAAAGWLLYEPVYNWATNLGESVSQGSSSQTAEPSSSGGMLDGFLGGEEGSSSQSVPEATDPAAAQTLHAVYMPESILMDASARSSFIADCVANGYNSIYFDLKDSAGVVTYRSGLSQITELGSASGFGSGSCFGGF